MTDADTSNPLLATSTLPYRLPDYRVIRPEHYLPAFEEAFAQHRRQIEAITSVTAAPTFENTMVPLEQSGELLHDVASAFYTVSSADATEDIQEIEETLAPLMAAHTDAVQLDAALYRRITSLHDELDDLELPPEDRYLVERHYRMGALVRVGTDHKPTRESVVLEDDLPKSPRQYPPVFARHRTGLFGLTWWMIPEPGFQKPIPYLAEAVARKS